MEAQKVATELDELISSLDFMPENVVQAAAEQPKLFLRAADYRMAKYRKYVQAEGRLEAERAATSLRLREQARLNGERLTENHIAELLTVDDNLRRLRAEVESAREADEYAKLLLEAYRMRRDCIRVVAELSSAELAMARIVEEGREALHKAKKALAEKYPGGKR